MKTENFVISKRLLNLLSNPVQVKVNTVTYKCYFEGYNMVSYNQLDIFLDIPITDKNYFCYNKKNKITYWPLNKGEQVINDKGQWKLEGREEIKPGKFLVILKDYFCYYLDGGIKITDEDLIKKLFTRLCELFAAKIEANNKDLEILFSDDIEKIYKLPVSPDAGYLVQSCMRQTSCHNCHNYSGFYNLIPGLKTAYGMRDDNLYFRALFWDCEGNEGQKITFLDRIYGTEAIQQKLIDYAIENSCAYRHFSDSNVIYNGKNINIHIKINENALNYLQDEGTPFVDTLNRLAENTLQLKNHGNYDYYLNDCEGVTLGNQITCDNCGVRLTEEDSYDCPGGVYCHNCFEGSYFTCDRCGEVCENEEHAFDGLCRDCARDKGYQKCDCCGEWVEDYRIVEGEYYCMCCADRFATTCEDCEELFLNENVNNYKIDGKIISICNDCLETHYYCCDRCGNYYSKKNEDNLCKECAGQLILQFDENKTESHE